MVDALTQKVDEGRGVTTKSPGEPLTGFDPGVSEWGNPSEQTSEIII